MKRLARIFWLGLKEMMSLRRDWVMIALLIWSFTLSPVMEATGVSSSVNNASIAFEDEDIAVGLRNLFISIREHQPQRNRFHRATLPSGNNISLCKSIDDVYS